MKKYFSRKPFTKDKVALRELKFAHTIIVLLSLSLIGVLNLLPNDFIGSEGWLIILINVLLVLVLAISVSIVLSLSRTRKR